MHLVGEAAKNKEFLYAVTEAMKRTWKALSDEYKACVNDCPLPKVTFVQETASAYTAAAGAALWVRTAIDAGFCKVYNEMNETNRFYELPE